MAFGSLDMERVCSAAPSTQLLELISKMNFDSMDPTLLVSLLIRRDFSFSHLRNVLNFLSFFLFFFGKIEKRNRKISGNCHKKTRKRDNSVDRSGYRER